MNPLSSNTPLSPDSALLLTFAALLLAPLVIAGLALVNTGLGRARSAAQSLLGTLLVASTAALGYAAFGAAWHLPDSTRTAGFFFANFSELSAHDQFASIFTLFAAALAAIIPWGAGADRLRLHAGLLIAVLTGSVFIPLLADSVWGDGWLTHACLRFGLDAGPLDRTGSGIIHLFGGLTALALLWTLGARRGKFPKPGIATALPGHQAVYVLFGCPIALTGWLAFNTAGLLLHGTASYSTLSTTLVNTLLMAATSLLTTFAITTIRFSKPDASLCANGWLAGLVASSAAASTHTPLEAVFTGFLTGLAIPLVVELLELALSIDDPAGAIPVHAIGGVIGLFTAGLFAGSMGQFFAQLEEISLVLGLGLPVVYLTLTAANHLLSFRVDPDGERLGMDMHELGGSAYPEYVLHRDDTYR